MTRFSEREGFKEPKLPQTDNLEQVTLNGLWSILYEGFDYHCKRDAYGNITGNTLKGHPVLYYLIRHLWLEIIQKPIDALPREKNRAIGELRGYFFEAWEQAADIIEAYVLAQINYLDTPYMSDPEMKSRAKHIDQLTEAFNLRLEKEKAAFRFIDNQLHRVTNELEIAELSKALSTNVQAIKEHISTALNLYSDRQKPDYRNSVKESISAVEAAVKHITGDKKDTLGKLLVILKNSGKLDPVLSAGYSKIYGYTSDKSGVRHALIDEDKIDEPLAKYMLVSCSAFVNYLLTINEVA